MNEGKIIAVSGIMGSGKTTLCRGLAQKTGWICLPETKIAKDYLPDFFADLNRYAYPTQLAFLCDKAIHIRQLLKLGKNIILDRTLYEDIYIFAKCWYDRGNINERDYDIYSELADFFLQEIPAPQLIIYCQCSIDETRRRIQKRDRDDQRNFPKGHLEDIKSRYDRWVLDISCSPIYSVDTEKYDVRTDRTIARIIEDIIQIGADQQLSFSNYCNQDTIMEETILKHINNVEPNAFFNEELFFATRKTGVIKGLVRPWAYIAAPFTAIATDADSQDEQSTIIEMPQLHGIIEPGEYRRMLQSVARKLNRNHIDSFIPHRDINEWGERVLTPVEAAASCASYVKDCDLFIGILGNSCGAHYEYGLAEGLNKPSVIVLCDEISTSFIGRGLENKSNRLVIHCAKISEISSLFDKAELQSFLRNNGLYNN